MNQLKKLLKLFIVLLFSFSSACYFNGNLNIIFSIPFVGFCLFNGLSYFLFSLIGITIGTICSYQINSYVDPLQYFYLLFALFLFFLLYYLFLLTKQKRIINYLLSTFFSILITYSIYIVFTHEITLYNYLYCIFLSAIVCLLFSFLIKNFSFHLFSFHNQNTPLLCGLLSCIFLSFLSLLLNHFLFSFILLILICNLIFLLANHYSIKEILCFLASFYMCSFLFQLEFITHYLNLFFILGCLFSFNPHKSKRYEPFLMIFSFIIFYLLQPVENNLLPYWIIVALLCSFTILFLPTFQTEKNANAYLRYVENKREIMDQFDNFQNMFLQIAENFKTARESQILHQVQKEVFDILCANCSHLKQCKQKGKHLLLNYLKDALNDELDDTKKALIQRDCLYYERYFRLLDRFTRSYLLEQFQNQEQAKLKEMVYENFYGFSKIMAQCKSNLSHDKLLVAANFYQSLKLSLSNYHYDVLYVNNHSTDERFSFEIAISNIKIKEVKEILLPLICDTLQTKMEIVSINTTTLTYSYFILSIQEVLQHSISYAIKQSKEDYRCNGDCYETLENKADFYLAISDGMGNGFLANEESKFTLDILFSILKTKMDVEQSIHLTNELIRLKDDFESYTTLDFLQIDKQTLQATFFKFGAFTSYIIRNHHVMDISNYALPLGIIDKIKYTPVQFTLQENDILLLCSDGMIDDNNTDILSVLEDISYDDASILCQTLFSQLLHVRKNNDDATLAIVTIGKKNR